MLLYVLSCTTASLLRFGIFIGRGETIFRILNFNPQVFYGIASTMKV